MRKYFLAVLLALASFGPLLSHGALVTCDGPAPAAGGAVCDFYTFFGMINVFIEYAIFLAFPITACIFAYAGFLLITEGGSPDTIKKAWGLIKDAGLGFGIMLLGWVFIRFIFDNLLSSSFSPAYNTLFSGH